jgi:hypothetical protein
LISAGAELIAYQKKKEKEESFQQEEEEEEDWGVDYESVIYYEVTMCIRFPRERRLNCLNEGLFLFFFFFLKYLVLKRWMYG